MAARQTDDPYDPYNPPARPLSASTTSPPINYQPYAGLQPIPVDHSGRRGLVILVLVTLLVLAGGGTGGYFFLRWLDDRSHADDVDLETAVARKHPAKLHAVDRIDTLRRATLQDKQFEKQLISDLDGPLGLGKTFVLAYRDTALQDSKATAQRTVILFGSLQRIDDPFGALVTGGYTSLEEADPAEAESESKPKASSGGSTTMGTIRFVDAGAAGGLALCALVTRGKVRRGSACAWADHGSRGAAFFYGYSVADATLLLSRMRSAIIIRPVSTPN